MNDNLSRMLFIYLFIFISFYSFLQILSEYILKVRLIKWWILGIIIFVWLNAVNFL